jgi:hypothetical protein
MMGQYRSEYRRQRFRQRSLGIIGLLLLVAFMIASGIILAYYFIPNPDLLLSSKSAQKAPGNRLVHLSFLGSDFYIPQSILKRAKRRMLGGVEQIDVMIPWPYDHLAVISGTVELTGDIREWVLLTFVANPNRVHPDARLLTTDRYYFAGPGRQDRSGLLRYDFKPDSPYRDLQLYVHGTDSEAPQVIRCDLKASSLGPILCEREIAATEKITARIRFARTNLDDWQDIERVSHSVIRALLRRTMIN